MRRPQNGSDGPVRRPPGRATSGPPRRVLVLNPTSGSGDHGSAVRSRAIDHGFEVHETTASGDAARIAREAADAGVSLLAIAGGDGTVHEAISGLYEIGSLREIDCAVVPTGTANFFAKSLGITDIDGAFDAIERGAIRRIDVGVANDEPFVSTCLVGIVAEANTATTSEAKRNLGVFAYVQTMLRLLPEYEGRPLRVTVRTSGAPEGCRWSGDVFFLLVGNAIRFPEFGRQLQANVEDGLFDVAIVEEPPTDLLDPRQVTRTISRAETPLVRLQGSAVTITPHRNGPLSYSLDGELRSAPEITIAVLERRLSIYVGGGYDPDPE